MALYFLFLITSCNHKDVEDISADTTQQVEETKNQHIASQEIIETDSLSCLEITTKGWTRVFDSQQYNEALNMGESAMKPLDWIICKSPNGGGGEGGTLSEIHSRHNAAKCLPNVSGCISSPHSLANT